MLNSNFVMSMVQSYTNRNNELCEEDFCNLFGRLKESELNEVLMLLDANGISVVEEKTDDCNITEMAGHFSCMSTISHLTALTNEQLCVLYQRGERAALDALVEKNSRLVYKIAARVYKEYHPESLEIEDLYIEGNMGLMKAAERFEITKGFKFSTYACWWIRQAITRETMNNGYAMRIPVHMFEQIIAVKQCRSKHEPNTIYELQDYLAKEGREYTIEKLNNLLILGDKYLNTASLNEVVGSGEDRDTERIAFIADKINLEDEILGTQMAEDIEESLAKILSDRERSVIVKRYGLGNIVPMTLEQIGQESGVTRERIRQIEAKALLKLASSYRTSFLKEYLCA